MSIKNIVGKTITGVMLAAAATYFAGCAGTEVSDSDPNVPDNSLAETADSQNPDISDINEDDPGSTSPETSPIDEESSVEAVPNDDLNGYSSELTTDITEETGTTDIPELETTAGLHSAETAEPEPEVDMSRMPAPAIDAVKEWTETPASGTFYVNDDGVSSREKPIQGSTRVKSFNTNDVITVTAITNTGYYKLSDGSFLHQDFTSSTKINTNPAPAPVLEQQPTATTKPDSGSGTNNNSGSNNSSSNSDNSSSSGSGTINSEGYYEIPGTQAKIPTYKIGMDLDANGLPVDTSKYPQFIDENGQGWQFAPGFGWAKASYTGHANIGHTNTGGPNGNKVGY